LINLGINCIIIVRIFYNLIFEISSFKADEICGFIGIFIILTFIALVESFRQLMSVFAVLACVIFNNELIVMKTFLVYDVACGLFSEIICCICFAGITKLGYIIVKVILFTISTQIEFNIWFISNFTIYAIISDWIYYLMSSTYCCDFCTFI